MEFWDSVDKREVAMHASTWFMDLPWTLAEKCKLQLIQWCTAPGQQPAA